MKASTARQHLRRYFSNEDKNYHSENLLLLALLFGTEEEIRECEKRVRTLNTDGPTYEIGRDMEHKISDYFDLLRKAAEPVEKPKTTKTTRYQPQYFEAGRWEDCVVYYYSENEATRAIAKIEGGIGYRIVKVERTEKRTVVESP